MPICTRPDAYAYAPAALKQAMSGNVKVLMVSVLVLIVVIAGYLLLRRRR